MEAFLPVAFLFIFAIIVSTAIFAITTILGPKNPTKVKESVYECGVKPEGSARAPFKLHFYLIAVLFLLFDVEAAFFLPWALVYRESLAEGPMLFMAFIAYMAFLVLAMFYIFKKNALRLNPTP